MKNINRIPFIVVYDGFEFMSKRDNRVNPFPLNDTFWRPWETSLLKILWEHKKLLLTSNFSFSHSVFYPFG